MSISPHFGRVSYGAAELQRVYVKYMTLAYILSVMLTFALLSPLGLLIDQESFNPTPQRIVRIFKYSEIELPRPIGDVEFGLSAYPVIETPQINQNDTRIEASALLPGLSNRTNAKGGRLPIERSISGGLSNQPGTVGADKLQADEKANRLSEWGNDQAPTDRSDIPGGSGESNEPSRKGGVPIPGKAGEPPSGFDRSGVGSSSRPSAGGTPYVFGAGDDGDGEDGGGFSLRWLQGMTRRKISGELPKYPPGVNVSAQVKILTVVLPNGTVKSVQPVQKANRVLEEAAMKSIRFWKFEQLGKSLPQVEQSCIVTFHFKVK